MKTIVVLGATGKQGGGVVRALLAQGQWHVRAVSRDPAGAAAKRLARRGVEVVAAGLDDRHTLRQVFAGAHGVYSVQNTDKGSELEQRQGIAVADAAAATGVQHFVYASVGGADRQSGVPHFESKWRVEQHVRKLGLHATIVRPTFLMDNFLQVPARLVLLALMRSYILDRKSLQMIAVDDIGKFVARAFAQPRTFTGKAFEIAGDQLTREEVVAELRRHHWNAGLPTGVPRPLLRLLPADILKMFEWFGDEGYSADIAALRATQPDLMTFAQWLAAKVTPLPRASVIGC